MDVLISSGTEKRESDEEVETSSESREEVDLMDFPGVYAIKFRVIR